MDLYISSLALGVVGLAAMAVSGLGSHSHAGQSGHAAGGHAGHVGAGHGQAGHAGAGHAGARGGHAPGGHLHVQPNLASRTLWAMASPRFLFSFFLGLGATGELLRPVLGGPLLFGAAVVGGIALERFLVAPLWNLAMRFASKPAVMLESAVSDEATAVTAFDANGQGIVSLELDGQVIQLLATLQPNDRLLRAGVRAGQRVRIEEVNAEKNCCTVSVV